MSQGIHYVVLFSSYSVLWFLCLFCLLPIGLDSNRDTEIGAPLKPMLGKKMLFATGIATVLWLGFFAAITFGWLEL